MAYDDGIITAPVLVADVQAALGTNECGLGALGSSAAINLWSRFKPIPSADPALRLTEGNAYRGTGACGIAVRSYARIASMMTLRFSDDWQYSGIGGTGNAARLGDFNGYDALAGPPVYGFNAPSYITQENNQVFKVTLLEGLHRAPAGGADVTDTTAPGSLTLSEIAVGNPLRTLSSLFLGVAVFRSVSGSIASYTLLYARTNPVPGALSVQTAFAPSTTVANGTTVYILPFWSTTPINDNAAMAATGTYYLPPGCTAKTAVVGTDEQAGGLEVFSITAAGRPMIALGGTHQAGTLSHIEIVARIKRNTAYTYQYVTIQLYDGDTGNILETFEEGPLSVAANTLHTIRKTIYNTNGRFNPSKSYWVALTLNRGYRTTASVMMPATIGTAQ